MPKETQDVDWGAVTARCLAFLCLKNSRSADQSLADQARFLQQLGLPIEDQAALLGSTPASLRELARLARSRNGGKQNGKAKRK